VAGGGVLRQLCLSRPLVHEVPGTGAGRQPALRQSKKGVPEVYGEPPDRSLVLAPIELYFAALDNRNFDLLRDVFTPDAIGEWRGEALVPDAILEGVEDIIRRVSKVSRFTSSTHIGGNSAFQAESPIETPTVITHAVSYLETGGQGPRVIVRGVTYEDTFVSTDVGWRIHRRIHRPTWQFSQAAEVADVSGSALQSPAG
jgi:hypothetical protein